MSITDWSATPANNNAAAPNGAPEGMAAASVNNTIRQIMADIKAGVSFNVDTIALMTALDVAKLGSNGLTFVAGYHSLNDGGGGFFYWDSASLLVANSGTIIEADVGGTGRWIRVLQSPVNVCMFGAVDGSTDAHIGFQAAIDYVADKDLALYVPSGNYEFSRSAAHQVENVALTKDFVFYGDGVDSKLKVADSVMTGDFQALFHLRNTDTISINMDVRGLFTNMNATNNIPPGGTASFDWQHNHAFYLAPKGVRGFNSVRYHNITCIDPVGDNCNISGNFLDNISEAIISDIFCYDRARTRSDITITCCYDSLSVSNCTVQKFEVETNSVDPVLRGELLVNNLNCDTFDIIYKTVVTPAVINNLICTGFFNMDGHDATFNNCHFTFKSEARLLGTSTLDNKLKFNSCSFDTDTSMTDTRFLFISTAATSPKLVEFNDCEFNNNGANATLVNYWEDPNTGFAGRLIKFTDCEFKCTSAMTSSHFYRSGEYAFNDNTFSGAITGDSFILQSSATTSITHSFKASGNEVQQASKFLWEPAIVATGSAIQIDMGQNKATSGAGFIVGFTRYDKIAGNRGVSTVQNFKTIDTFESNGTPTTGRYVIGTRIYEEAPAAAGKIGVVCTTSGLAGSGAVFKPFGAIDA